MVRDDIATTPGPDSFAINCLIVSDSHVRIKAVLLGAVQVFWASESAWARGLV